MKKKILLIPHNLDVNGSNTFLIMLANTLKSFFNFSILIENCSNGKILSFFKKNNLELIHSDPGSNLADIFKKYDVITINTLMQADKVRICKKINKPHLLVIHENWDPEKLNTIEDLWGLSTINKEIILSALETSQQIILPAKYLFKTYQNYLPSNKGELIYCAIDSTNIEKYVSLTSQQAERKKLGISQITTVFTQLGTITKRKGQLISLKSFIQFRNNRQPTSDSMMIFVGANTDNKSDNVYLDEIKYLIDLHQLHDCVKIYPTQEDILSFIIASDIIVHPSTSEVLPIVLLESAMCKKPIITSNLDGMPEIITHGESGILINDPRNITEITEAMTMLASCKDLQTIFGERIYKKVFSQHNIEIFRDKYFNEINTA